MGKPGQAGPEATRRCALMELVAISARGEVADSGRANLVNSLYGVPVILAGVGLLVGGIALIRSTNRAEITSGWLGHVIAALGAYVFVPLLPAIMGPDVAARLSIGGWMLLFAAIGWGLADVPARRGGVLPAGG